VSEERTKKRPAASACRAFAPSAGGHTANKKQKRHTQKIEKRKKDLRRAHAGRWSLLPEGTLQIKLLRVVDDLQFFFIKKNKII